MTQSAALLTAPIRVWQYTLRPLLGPNCRFIPSCSDYAIEAIERHGPVQGVRLATSRILRCNPWCRGGHDPVPPTTTAQPGTATH
jgi:putative membrane protein insertion efficiency factor